jgi:hypothetical protein
MAADFGANREDLAMPLASQWSRQEVAIIVYFLSIRPITLCYLLLRRGYDRSASAIEHIVVSIAKKYPYLKRQGDWDLDFVDRWIDDLLEITN